MPPPTSKAWNYFKRTTDSKTVKCKLCETELTYAGGTTNMLNHLRLKHNTEFEHENTPQKQPSIPEFVRSPRSRHLSGTKTEDNNSCNCEHGRTGLYAIKNCWRIRFQKPYVSYSTGMQCSVAQHNQGKNRQSIWWGKVKTPCIVHKCGKTSIDTSNRVLDRKKYRLTG